MRALSTLMIAGTALALFSAPALAAFGTQAAPVAETAAVTAQAETCRGFGCSLSAAEITPEFCIAEGKCATALPAASLLRYDELMDGTAGD
jgi:hypothetical protein